MDEYGNEAKYGCDWKHEQLSEALNCRLDCGSESRSYQCSDPSQEPSNNQQAEGEPKARPEMNAFGNETGVCVVDYPQDQCKTKSAKNKGMKRLKAAKGRDKCEYQRGDE
jgi:hypothetical protein